MSTVVGETLGLKASERNQLEKLLSRKNRPDELVSGELARRVSGLSVQTGRQMGLLIGRNGQIEHVIVGSKNRIYLPDLGRFRLDTARLRRIRLIVFLPTDDGMLERYFGGSISFAASSTKYESRSINAPVIAPDLITDLEKLRLDCVLVVAPGHKENTGAASLAYLDPRERKKGAGKSPTMRTQVGYLHRADIADFDFSFNEFVSQIEALYEQTRAVARDKDGDNAVLLGASTESLAEANASMAELQELARTAGIDVLDTIIQRRRSLDPRTVIGKGKVEEVVLHCLDLGANMLIFDRELTPGQLRSIANLTELKVLDRSMLILDIFAQRAKSSEGRLQVELAQLRYSLPRLTETDTGLSRLSGGIGGRGPGETKLEIGRRRARDRITELEKRIEKVSNQRGLRRERRQVRGVPVIAIIGYTNAGKSTLLNALTKGNVLVENKLFATLDPSSRRMRFPNDKEVIFVDTVGFIRELPKELVTAFRATLEEVGEADVLLQLVDASSPEAANQITVVEETISSLGFGETPRLLVMNKIDLLSELERNSLENTYGAFMISSLKREGFELLLSRLQEELHRSFQGQDPGRFTELSGTGPKERRDKWNEGY